MVETVWRGSFGEQKLRIVKKDGQYHGVIDNRACIAGPDWRVVQQQLHEEAGKLDARYFGFDEARARFRGFFPDAFDSERYNSKERDYKVRAKELLDSNVPCAEALSGTGFGENALAVFRGTNLLSPFEKVKVTDMLRGPSADKFVQTAAGFACDCSSQALGRLARVLKPHDCAKWTIATYLPFLWRPDFHMFLKPEATRDFAAGVGHEFGISYQPQIQFDVYESLLDLADRTSRELVGLSPRDRPLDRIDIQSFIWVVGNYRKDQDGSCP